MLEQLGIHRLGVCKSLVSAVMDYGSKQGREGSALPPLAFGEENKLLLMPFYFFSFLWGDNFKNTFV